MRNKLLLTTLTIAFLLKNSEPVNDDLSGCRYVCITGRRFRRRRRRTQIIYCFKKNKSAFLCVICARLRPVNTSKRTDKLSFIVSNMSSFGPPVNQIDYNNPHFRLFFYFVRNLDRFSIDPFHDFNRLG